jgi:iron(III) transport system ATP-binding protein
MPPSALNPAVTADRPAAATESRAGHPPPALEIEDLRIRYGKVEAVKGISFSVTPGEFLTLLGPSGCGKTTTLRCIAGLEVPSAGVVRIDGVEVANARRQLPPQRRGINMVFQSYAVWPHMTVEQNVAYGLHGRKLPRKEIRERTERALELVGLEDYRKRYGTELSGGQQQRVAVARAVVTDPKIILLDEPLSNLDAGLRERMRDELLSLHRRIGRTAIYVTHDQSEAMAMSDRIILMKDGTIEQIAAPRELYAAPQSRFAADFVGTTNVLLGNVAYQDGQAVFRESSGAMTLVLDQGPAAGDCLVLFRPELVQLDRAITTPANRFDLRVSNVAFLGNRCDVTGTVGGVRLRIEAPADFHAAPQSVVPIAFPPETLRCLPDEPETL